MIHALGLRKDYGLLRAVDGLSFEVQPGQIYGLLGPNGAGKTTTMRLLGGLLQPTAGTAVVAGFGVQTEPRAVRARIGLLTEVPGLYLRLTPLEYLDFFGQLHGLDGRARGARIEHLLRLVGLWERRGSVMRAFSKGTQQRVAIARTLLQEPQVLLLDEPTAALDPEAARAVRDEVQELASQRGRTVLLSTHNLYEAEHLCTRLSVMQAGRQIAEGSPTALRSGAARRCVLRLADARPALLPRIAALPAVERAAWDGDSTLVYHTRWPQQVNPQVVRLAVADGADVLGLAEQELSLEEIYLSLMLNPRPAAAPAVPEPPRHPAPAPLTRAAARPFSNPGGARRTGPSASRGHCSVTACRVSASEALAGTPPRPLGERPRGSAGEGRSDDSQPGAGRRLPAALLVARRELRETVRDPNLVLPLIVLPLLIGLLAGLTTFFSFSSQPNAPGGVLATAALDQLPPAAVTRLNNLPTPSGDRTATLETLLKAFSIPLFWVIPVALTPAIAADSFVGERERASLEPLLATPIGTGQVLLGKLLASVVPAVLGTWLGVLAFWLLGLASGSPLHAHPLPADADWRFSLLVVTPLVALFTASVAAVISTRSAGYRVAYQLTGLVSLPVVLVLIPAAAFGFLLSAAALGGVAVLFGVCDVLLLAWSGSLFTRERLLSRR